MSSIIEHAKMEFRAAGFIDDNGTYCDEMQEAICKHVLDLLKVFSDEGHSGTTAPYTINMFKKLASFEPLIPLTGEDWEWAEVMEGVFQNKRCSRVFKQADRFNGQAYDIEAVVFYEMMNDSSTGEPFKSYFTCADSFAPVTFPYTPTTEYRLRLSDDTNTH